jgi:hypothetical protein
MVQHRVVCVDWVPSPAPPTDTRLVTIRLATELSGFSPYVMNLMIIDEPRMIRSTVVGGRRLLVLSDVLELAAVARLR